MLEYLKWIKKIGGEQTGNNKNVDIFEFQYEYDDIIMNEWAKHFRQQYCSEIDLDEESQANKLSKSEYLLQIKFPTEHGAPGPSIRAGDFAEILIADFIQFTLNYCVPRTRYDCKTIRNESTKGCDIIAFKPEISTNSNDDEMLIVEVKAQFSGNEPKNRLQDAIDDSKKDISRLAESLNAMKQRLKYRGEKSNAAIVQRYQNATDTPYKRRMGAATVQSTHLYDSNLINIATTEGHPDDNISLLVIKGDNLMSLVHDLYRRASIC